LRASWMSLGTRLYHGHGYGFSPTQAKISVSEDFEKITRIFLILPGVGVPVQRRVTGWSLGAPSRRRLGKRRALARARRRNTAGARLLIVCGVVQHEQVSSS
jgi:hypothetical protein